MDYAASTSSPVPAAPFSAALPAGLAQPFWFELWQNVGWSRRVARIWSSETAFREQDRRYLDRVLPTLAAGDRSFVEAVIRREAGGPAGRRDQ